MKRIDSYALPIYLTRSGKESANRRARISVFASSARSRDRIGRTSIEETFRTRQTPRRDPNLEHRDHRARDGFGIERAEQLANGLTAANQSGDLRLRFRRPFALRMGSGGP